MRNRRHKARKVKNFKYLDWITLQDRRIDDEIKERT
jgi:hypothetical protein